MRIYTVTRLEQFADHETQPNAIPFVKAYRTLQAAKKAVEDDAEAEEAGDLSRWTIDETEPPTWSTSAPGGDCFYEWFIQETHLED